MINRNYWFESWMYGKTLLSKIKLNWVWGFHYARVIKEKYMFKVIKKQIRPNTSVDFYVPNSEVLQWLSTNYIQTGKMMVPESSISENELEMTTTVLFQSEEVAREWKYNTYVVENLHTPNEAYCAANGIELLPAITIGEV
jgi:hypothetical protein